MLLEANFFRAHTIVCVACGVTPLLEHAFRHSAEHLQDIANRVTVFAVCTSSRTSSPTQSFVQLHVCCPTLLLPHHNEVAGSGSLYCSALLSGMSPVYDGVPQASC